MGTFFSSLFFLQQYLFLESTSSDSLNDAITYQQWMQACTLNIPFSVFVIVEFDEGCLTFIFQRKEKFRFKQTLVVLFVCPAGNNIVQFGVKKFCPFAWFCGHSAEPGQRLANNIQNSFFLNFFAFLSLVGILLLLFMIIRQALTVPLFIKTLLINQG